MKNGRLATANVALGFLAAHHAKIPCTLIGYRESIVLGKTNCYILKVNQILRELSWEWPGQSYELLSRNCNHFCNTLCEKLEVPKLPGTFNFLLFGT